jgi:hypothetical protein
MTKLTTRQARALLASPENQEKVSSELGHIAQADITDVISWTGDVAVLNASDTLAPHVRKAIKKVKITPGKYGNAIEVEMHDKLGALRMLARATGMMDQAQEESNRPTMIGIKLNLSKVEEVIYAKEDRGNGPESADGE